MVESSWKRHPMSTPGLHTQLNTCAQLHISAHPLTHTLQVQWETNKQVQRQGGVVRKREDRVFKGIDMREFLWNSDHIPCFVLGLYVCICVYIFVCVSTLTGGCVYEGQGSISGIVCGAIVEDRRRPVGSALSFYYIGPRIWTHIIRLDSKSLYPLSQIC